MADYEVTVAQTIVQARHWWKHLRENGKADYPEFDVMLEKFKNDCLNFIDIAEELGITPERIRQIYRRYFSKILPRRPNGRMRRKICTRKNRSVKVRESFATDPRFAVLKARAEEKGITVEPLQTTHRRTVMYSMKLLILNHHLCNFRISEMPDRGYKGRRYWRFNVTARPRVKYLILQAGTGSDALFLIVPTVYLRGRVQITIPADLQYAGIRGMKLAKYHWLEYLDAWHFLKAPTGPAANE